MANVWKGSKGGSEFNPYNYVLSVYIQCIYTVHIYSAYTYTHYIQRENVERERKKKRCAVGREAERKNLLMHVRERGVFIHGEISHLERAAAGPTATEGRAMSRRTVATLTRIA